MADNSLEYEKKIIERQRKYSEALGVSGFEEKIIDLIIEEIKPIVDKYWINSTGSLLAVMSSSKNNNAILLDCHLDEIGFIITHVTDKGFAYFNLIGGWDERLLLGQSVIVEPNGGDRLHGVIGALPPHVLTSADRKNSITFDKLFIDFGFKTKNDAEKLGVKVGIVGTLYSGFQELYNGRLRGKAFDDRSGCNILTQTALNLQGKELPCTICFSWSSQEEVGIRGARTSAYAFDKQYNIEMAIACENTTAADVPGVPPQKCPSIMGKGPAITIMDSNMIASKKVRNRLVKVAELNKIQYQIKVPSRGGTDAGAIHLTRSGIPSGVVSVPGRYIHSPCTIIDKKDLIAAVDLITAFVLQYH
ncbi:MAG: M42 family metallopeptidase [Promethearchaeota archaeon]